jgi:hypothetical protein
VLTDYPWGDEVLVQVHALAPVLLKLRVPGWASNASVAIDAAAPQHAPPARYFHVRCAGGVTTRVALSLHPEIRVERGWGASDAGAEADAAVVVRGPLLFALPLDEETAELHAPWACFEHGCAQDLSVTSSSPWNYALVLPPGAPAAAMRFERTGPPSRVPFASGGGGAAVRIHAAGRRVPSWGTDPLFAKSAAVPPRSPLACSSAGSQGSVECGPIESLTLVPFGATRLRVAMFPWAES